MAQKSPKSGGKKYLTAHVYLVNTKDKTQKLRTVAMKTKQLMGKDSSMGYATNCDTNTHTHTHHPVVHPRCQIGKGGRFTVNVHIQEETVADVHKTAVSPH